MKRLFAILSLFMILASIAAFAETRPQPKKALEKPAQEAPAAKNKYIIHLKDGGTLETSNYIYEGGKVKIMLRSGYMSLDRSMILRIEEIKFEDDTETERTLRLPEETKARPSTTRKSQPETTAPARRPEPGVPADENGHTELWWKQQVNEWKKKLADAQDRFEKAQNDWNKYNGLVTSLPPSNTPNPSTSNFQATQYQDLRGASRVAMDQAQADMDEARRMLEVVLPDEARKAGAPPGWAR